MNEFDTDRILLLLYLAFKPTPDEWEKIAEERKREERFQENCPNIEWEQDMGKTIPFCKLDGDLCNMQCMNGKTQPRMGCEL